MIAKLTPPGSPPQRPDSHPRLTDYSRLDRTVFTRPRVQPLEAIVVGAGALGNEVVKALGLLGAGRIAVIDPDLVHPSNLTRSVFFRTAACAGCNKASALVASASSIFPDTAFRAIEAPIADVGFGELTGANIMFSCVDSDLARLEMAWISKSLRLPVADGGLGSSDYSHGRISWFPGKSGACFGCKLTARKRRDLLTMSNATVRPCDDAPLNGDETEGYPSTPTMAAIVGSLQVELGLRNLFDGAAESSTFELSFEGTPRAQWFRTPPSASCPFHDPEEQSRIAAPDHDATVDSLLAAIETPPGATACFELDWPICAAARCQDCHAEWSPMRRCAAFRRNPVCPSCGSRSILELESIHSIELGSRWSGLALRALGLPRKHLFRVRFHSQ